MACLRSFAHRRARGDIASRGRHHALTIPDAAHPIGTDPARAQHMLDRMIAYLRATLSGESTEPALELVAQDGSVLKFVGEPTPETLYGSAGEIMFLEGLPGT